ncbi:P-II family nitrogen regulator [Dysosmobacter sp.]
MSGVHLIIAVTDRSRCGEFAAWFQSQGVPLVLTALGRGTATTEILDCLGLEATEKAVLFCLTSSSRMVRRTARELWLDVPGNGIVLAVPVTSIGGTAAKDTLVQEEEGVCAMEQSCTHELLVVITSEGHTDLVMEAAREAGATGGTVVHAKGTGSELAQKFFGVSIATEKELVFILTRAGSRKEIMRTIMTRAGMHTEAKSVVFSLPVSDLAGLRQLETEAP